MMNISSNKLWLYGLLIAGLLFVSDRFLGDDLRSNPFEGELRSDVAANVETAATNGGQPSAPAMTKWTAKSAASEDETGFDSPSDDFGDDEDIASVEQSRPIRGSESPADNRPSNSGSRNSQPLFKDLKKAGI